MQTCMCMCMCVCCVCARVRACACVRARVGGWREADDQGAFVGASGKLNAYAFPLDHADHTPWHLAVAGRHDQVPCSMCACACLSVCLSVCLSAHCLSASRPPDLSSVAALLNMSCWAFMPLPLFLLISLALSLLPIPCTSLTTPAQNPHVKVATALRDLGAAFPVMASIIPINTRCTAAAAPQRAPCAALYRCCRYEC